MQGLDPKYLRNQLDTYGTILMTPICIWKTSPAGKISYSLSSGLPRPIPLPDAMPAKDLYHDTVKTALIKDGWTITDDPLTLKIGTRSAAIDLGAEKLIAAERGTEKWLSKSKALLAHPRSMTLKKPGGNFSYTLDHYAEKSQIDTSI